MFKAFFASTIAISLLSGVAIAQSSSSSSTTTQTTVAPIAPMPSDTSVSTTTQRSMDANGVVTEMNKTSSRGSTVSPMGR